MKTVCSLEDVCEDIIQNKAHKQGDEKYEITITPVFNIVLVKQEKKEKSINVGNEKPKMSLYSVYMIFLCRKHRRIYELLDIIPAYFSSSWLRNKPLQN